MRRALLALNVFRSFDHNMPLGVIGAFLHVATAPGLSVAEIAARCRIAQSTASRYVQYLGRQDRNRLPGMLLLDKRKFGRRVGVILTPAGRELLAELHSVIEAHRLNGRTSGADSLQ